MHFFKDGEYSNFFCFNPALATEHALFIEALTKMAESASRSFSLLISSWHMGRKRKGKKRPVSDGEEKINRKTNAENNYLWPGAANAAKFIKLILNGNKMRFSGRTFFEISCPRAAAFLPLPLDRDIM